MGGNESLRVRAEKSIQHSSRKLETKTNYKSLSSSEAPSLHRSIGLKLEKSEDDVIATHVNRSEISNKSASVRHKDRQHESLVKSAATKEAENHHTLSPHRHSVGEMEGDNIKDPKEITVINILAQNVSKAELQTQKSKSKLSQSAPYFLPGSVLGLNQIVPRVLGACLRFDCQASPPGHHCCGNL